jgi:hypothetical protein
MASIRERETQQVEQANASGKTAEVALLRFQRSAWLRIATTPVAELGDEGDS